MNLSLNIFFYSFLLAVHMNAQPAVSRMEIINGINIYPDAKNAVVYYYAPGDIVLATDNFGAPLYKFFQIRYSGSAVTGDQGKINYRSILEFTVKQNHLDTKTIDGIVTVLKQRTAKAELHPMPIKRMEAALVYALDQPSEQKEKATTISGGKFESTNDAGNADELWTERMFTLSLDNTSSQLLWSSLENGQVLMSLCYSLYTKGIVDSLSLSRLTFTGNLPTELAGEISDFVNASKKDTTKQTFLIKTSATGLAVDLTHAADRIKKIDINENSIPPDYAVLDIRCYDFNNELRPDLYAKRFEASATGMDGHDVKQSITFYSTAPDIYYSGLRFKYAVKMDKPLKYRVIEIQNDAAPIYGKWREQKNWNNLIDITTR